MRLRLRLERSDVAQQVARFAALVGSERRAVGTEARGLRNLVDGNTARTEGMRLRGASVVLQWSEGELPFGDAALIADLVEAAGVAGGFEIVPEDSGPRSRVRPLEWRRRCIERMH